jgi:hypothetical protein
MMSFEEALIEVWRALLNGVHKNGYEQKTDRRVSGSLA